jgi:hypothetical protein
LKSVTILLFRFKYLIFKANIVFLFWVVGACKRLGQNSVVSSSDSTGTPTGLEAFVSDVDGYLEDPQRLHQLFRKSSKLGISKLFVVVWTKGCTLFDFPEGIELGLPLRCRAYRLVPDLLKLSDVYNIKVVPWVEWGLQVPSDSEIAKSAKFSFGPEEIFHDVKTKRLNPWSNGNKVIHLFDSMFLRIQKEFKADEIHICDNHALPVSTLNSLQKGQKDFEQFIEKITENSRKLGVSFTLSTHVLSYAKRHFLVNWRDLLNAGSIKKVYIETYHVRNNPLGFLGEITNEKQNGARGVAIYTGSKSDWKWSSATDQINLSFARGLSAAIFDMGNLIKRYIPSEMAAEELSKNLRGFPLPKASPSTQGLELEGFKQKCLYRNLGELVAPNQVYVDHNQTKNVSLDVAQKLTAGTILTHHFTRLNSKGRMMALLSTPHTMKHSRFWLETSKIKTDLENSCILADQTFGDGSGRMQLPSLAPPSQPSTEFVPNVVNVTLECPNPIIKTNNSPLTFYKDKDFSVTLRQLDPLQVEATLVLAISAVLKIKIPSNEPENQRYRHAAKVQVGIPPLAPEEVWMDAGYLWSGTSNQFCLLRD